MGSRHDEEFELVLGNKQLLSLFFLAVLLFAVFFSIGYSVGYGRGQEDRVLAETEEPAEAAPAPEAVPLPDALLKDEPAPVPAAAAPAGSRPSPTQIAAREAERRSAPAPKRPGSQPRQAQEPRSSGGDPPARAVPGTEVVRSIHLQVAALRVRADAQTLVNQLKTKGYPVALYDQGGDGWHRVVVGPFQSETAAKVFQKKLQDDGLEPMLRKPRS